MFVLFLCYCPFSLFWVSLLQQLYLDFRFVLCLFRLASLLHHHLFLSSSLVFSCFLVLLQQHFFHVFHVFHIFTPDSPLTLFFSESVEFGIHYRIHPLHRLSDAREKERNTRKKTQMSRSDTDSRTCILEKTKQPHETILQDKMKSLLFFPDS